MQRFGVDDVEDLSAVTLLDDDRRVLLDMQTECTFVFNRPGGWPSGVVMSFLAHEGDLWFTSVADRAQVASLASDPRVTLVISNAGTSSPGRQMLAIRGVATVHRDREILDTMLLAIAGRLQPADPRAFVRLLDSPQRVVIQVRPVAVSASHDSRRMPGDGRGLPRRDET
ncbi:MAG: hypothetical protein GC157_03890 [Frankiales bacterium]|nr:hypothetical protein [Frankiales bacterium]